MFAFLCSLFVPACFGSDETLFRGVPGTYTRHNMGLTTEKLTLRQDGTYLFDVVFDMGSDREKGTWVVRDSCINLTPKTRGSLFKNLPSRFRIVVIDHDLALSVIDESSTPDNETDSMRLFTIEKKKANQHLSTTAQAKSGESQAGGER